MSVDKKDIYPKKSTAKKDQRPRQKHPKGWEPGMVLEEGGDNLTGVLIPSPRPKEEGELIDPNQEPWEQHLIDAGLDPSKIEVLFPVEIRTWDGYVKNESLIAKVKAALNAGEEPPAHDDADLIIKTKLVYFKAKIRAKTAYAARLDQEVMDFILQWRPTKAKEVAEERALVIPWADWQIGKDDGDGTKGTIERILNSFDQVYDVAKEFKPSKIIVASLGDMIENCAGHYPQQTYRVEMNLRDQEHTVRRLVVAGLKMFSDLAPAVEVFPIGGNHGEVRDDGKSFTDFADNFDVGIYEAVADQLGENVERFGNIAFRIPRDDLTQSVEVYGHYLGMLHGHQAKTGGRLPEQKIEHWIKNQLAARHPVADADIIISGHYHRFYWRTFGPRNVIQMPAMDGGSQWWDDAQGGMDPAGQVVFTIDRENGLDNLRVLPAERVNPAV